MTSIFLNAVVLSALFGIIGALCRIVIILLESFRFRKSVHAGSAIFYVATLFSIGAFSGIIFGIAGGAMSFLSGYAGMDLMDMYSKALKRKKVVID